MAALDMNWAFGDTGVLTDDIRALLGAKEQVVQVYRLLGKTQAALTNNKIIYISARGLIDARPDIYTLPLSTILAVNLIYGTKNEVQLVTNAGTIHITLTKINDLKDLYRELSRSLGNML